MIPLAIIKNLASNQAFIFQMLMFTFLAIGFIAVIIYAIKEYIKKGKGFFRTLFVAVTFGGIAYLFMLIAIDNYKLLTDYTYVIGETIERCSVGKRHEPGVSFKYAYQGREYTYCEVASDNLIMIPHKYKVRVSPNAPSSGVIDFSQPVR